MSLADSIGAIFDKLLTPRIAATAALASFVFLLATGVLMALQLYSQLETVPNFSDRKVFAVLASNVSPSLVKAASTFFIILVTALCSLTVGGLVASVRLLREALVNLLERANRDLRKLERTEKTKTENKDEGLREMLTFVTILYPYGLIIFDLIFYTCVAVVVLAIILLVLALLAIIPFLPYLIPVLAVFGVLGIIIWVGDRTVTGGVDLLRGLRKKPEEKRLQRQKQLKGKANRGGWGANSDRGNNLTDHRQNLACDDGDDRMKTAAVTQK